MDNNMEIDTARSPEPHNLSPTSDPGSIPTLDGWIESLMTCKQLAEEDVRRLCDRVGSSARHSAELRELTNFCISGTRGIAGGVERAASGMFIVIAYSGRGVRQPT
jgi:hypothetical protein